MGVEHLQQCVALGPGQLGHVGRVGAVDEEQFAPGLRMPDHHGVLRAGDVVLRRRGLARGGPWQGAVVQGGQAVEEGPHGRGEQLVGQVHVGEEGVATAAALRNLRDVQHGAERGLGVGGAVGVPAVARDLPGLLRGLDLQDVRIGVLGRNGHGVQLAEEGGEALVLLGRDVLVAEDQHMVGEERVLEFLLLLRRQLL